jgi:hypothetical protein
MAKLNRTKGQTMIYKNITHKTKDQAKQTPLKTGMNTGISSLHACVTSDTRRATVKRH